MVGLSERLRAMCVDWDNTQMRDGEEPRSVPSCGELREAADLIDRYESAISDPAAVHVNMLRGTIAKPSVRNIWHLYGEEALLAEAPDHIRAATRPEAADLIDRYESALEKLAHNFETGWAGDCESRAAVIRRVESIARAALAKAKP